MSRRRRLRAEQAQNRCSALSVLGFKSKSPGMPALVFLAYFVLRFIHRWQPREKTKVGFEFG